MRKGFGKWGWGQLEKADTAEMGLEILKGTKTFAMLVAK